MTLSWKHVYPNIPGYCIQCNLRAPAPFNDYGAVTFNGVAATTRRSPEDLAIRNNLP